MSRARFTWMLGLSLVVGLMAASVARMVHAWRRDPVGRDDPPATIVPLALAPAPAAAEASPAPDTAVALRRTPSTMTLPVLETLDHVDEPVIDLVDHEVIDLTDGALWATPVDGECPDGFPIKAKVSSGIFHLPGMSAYRRTNPDRCYASIEDALLDGLRAAKR